MDQPTMFDPISVANGVHALPAFVPLPGLGVIPVNAFVIEAAEPVLVDSGIIPLRLPENRPLNLAVRRLRRHGLVSPSGVHVAMVASRLPRRARPLRDGARPPHWGGTAPPTARQGLPSSGCGGGHEPCERALVP